MPGTESDVIAERALAFAIDVLLLHVVLAAVLSVVAGIASAIVAITGTPPTAVADVLVGTTDAETLLAVGAAAMGVLITVALPTYFVLFEWRLGQTPGKLAMGIAVVGTDGEPIGLRGAVVRNLLRVVDSLPSLYLLGLGAMLATERTQRVGDVAAETVVVRTSAGGDGTTAAPSPANGAA